MSIIGALGRLFALLQIILGLRVASRMARTAGGRPIAASDASTPERVTILVPVLNEDTRLAPCLDGLIAQPEEATEIIVIDGGSTDGTAALVTRYAARDPRIRLLEGVKAPAGVNGKAHQLAMGVRAAGAANEWVLTIDADVRPSPGLTRSLLAHAARERVNVLSVATRQRLSGAGEALIHPAMLTTLVYRFGIPGRATKRVGEVQANGQCFLVRRRSLDRVSGFAGVTDAIAEDVALARSLAATGERVGFSEGGDLVAVEMYRDLRDAWRNWPRSLPLRDRTSAAAAVLGLIEVTLVQAAPLAVVLTGLAGWRARGLRQPLVRLNLALLAMRLGVLVGTRRAYDRAPVAYWLSPVTDLPVAIRVWWSLTRRRQSWRGREIIRGGPGVSGGSE